jgi:copper chaperone CopZ
MGYYIHNVQGRLRVKTPLIKKSPLMAQEIQRLLRQIDGVNTTTVNTLTGSAVIHYDPKAVSSKEILDTLKEAGYFDLSRAVTNDEYVYSAAAKTGGIIWRSLAGAFVEQVLQGSVLSLIAVLM